MLETSTNQTNLVPRVSCLAAKSPRWTKERTVGGVVPSRRAAVPVRTLSAIGEKIAGMSFHHGGNSRRRIENKSYNLPAPEEGEIGPLLIETIELQRRDETATSYPGVESYAARLVSLCETHGNPLVWPVGAAAERLAGAAVLAGKGRVRARGWSDDVTDHQVLIVCTAVATPLGLRAAASQARALGAKSVHGCAIELRGVEPEGLADVLDSYSSLEAGQSGAKRQTARRRQRRIVMDPSLDVLEAAGARFPLP